jgi:hypothetical protein
MNFDRGDLFLEPKVKQYASHMVMTNVIKPTKIKYYSLDTRFRDDYDEYSKSSPSVYNISIPQRINDVKSISVKNIEIPLTFYNISASLENNIFEVVYNGISKTIIIPDGQYDATGLTTAINQQLVVVGYSSLVYSVQGYKSVFTDLSAIPFTINFSVKSQMTTSGISSQTEFNRFNFKGSLGFLLGFRSVTYLVVNSSPVISETLIDLNGPRYLYLVLDEFNQGNPNSFVAPLYTSFLNNNIIAKISLDTTALGGHKFGTIYAANHSNGYLLTDKRIYTGKVDLQRMKLQLVNEIGLPINLNGLDFSFALEIEYE